MAGVDAQRLVGSWVHAHEEDDGGEMVFRPASQPMPPARGRTSLELRPDGSYVERAPGPVDVPEQSTGRWSLDGSRLVLESEGDQPRRSLEVTAADADRLTVRNPPAP